VERLTAFLIVRDEERLLPRCLASLAGVVDAVVALDTGSRDGTPRILAAAAADPAPPELGWERLAFDGFGPARQAALDRVSGGWALWIDADEELSPALRARLRELRDGGGLATADAWSIRLENRVFGRVMRGRNLAGQYRTRLFRRELGRITPTPVHEGLELAPGARLGRIEEPLRHDTLISWRRYLRKVDRYTALEVASGRRVRCLPLHLLVTAPATLWRELVARGGWRDGWPGLVWAATTAWSSLLLDARLLRRALGGGD
jgi:glycosyltransferase involved in cell wall biosynthesis